MQVVYIPGVWDLLHVGHVTILERAKAFGDTLIVGVPSDDVVTQDKGQPPTITLDHRIRMLNALRCVDVAIPYYKLEFMTHLRMLRPDVFIAGETWGTDVRHRDAEAWLRENQKRFVQLPYSSVESSTSIKLRIKNEQRSH